MGAIQSWSAATLFDRALMLTLPVTPVLERERNGKLRSRKKFQRPIKGPGGGRFGLAEKRQRWELLTHSKSKGKEASSAEEVEGLAIFVGSSGLELRVERRV